MSPERMGGEGAVLTEELKRADRAKCWARAAILVEGTSDQRAIVTLARRRNRHLEAEGVAVVATAGATNIGAFLEILASADLELAGLCDEAEEPEFRQALEQSGLGTDLDRTGLERLGFFVCAADLEDELIRALGAKRMVALMEEQGDLRRFRSFQNQPAQRHKTVEQQLWRWLGNHKIRYASLMVNALDLDVVSRPLRMVIDSV